MTTSAWIGLGSNLGDRRAILDASVLALAARPGVEVRAVSSYHETQPVGGPPGQGPFLNAAAHLETTLDPYQLLLVLQEVEAEAGRVRLVRWGERTLDLDLLIYGPVFLDEPNLKLPHPRLPLRRFVLAPLAEIAPTVVDPMTRRTVANLLANLDRKPRLLSIEAARGDQKLALFRRLVEELPGFGISEAELESTGLEPELPEAEPRPEPLTPPFPFEALERKAEALKASHWAIETLRVPWIVTDYFLGFDFLRATTLSWGKDDPRPEARDWYNAHREGIRRVRAGMVGALRPTFVVILPRGQDLRRRPGVIPVPHLWSEAEDTEAIVAEVVAACRAIEGVS